MLAVAAATLATLLGGAVALPAATHEHRALFTTHAKPAFGYAQVTPTSEWKAALTTLEPGYAAALRRARPNPFFRVPLFAARTFNAKGQSRVTLSLR